VKNTEGGTKVGLGSLPYSGLNALTSRRREETPWKVLGGCGQRAGLKQLITLERRLSSREDEPVIARERGPVLIGIPRGLLGNRKAEAGSS
jgi:hypothetical protein